MTTNQTPLVDLLRLHAEDLHSDYGHNKSARLLSQAADEIERLRAELAEIAAALSDDRYVGSKDWRDSNVLGRIECLHVMYASASAEAELWLAHLTDAGGQINRLRVELTEARRDAGRYRRLCSLVAWGTLGVCCVAEAGDDYADDGVMLDAWLDDPEMIAEVQGIDAAMAGGSDV